MQYWKYLLGVTVLVGSTGCTLSDIGCIQDTDCREGRVCEAGACVGEVAIDDGSTNNVANNSVANANPNNQSQNNGNNQPANNQNNQNNVDAGNNSPNNVATNNANNVTVVACNDSGDCDEPQVCAPQDDGTLACTEPWNCELAGSGGGSNCFALWECDRRGELVLECRFGDQDRGVCVCVGDEGGFVEFETSRDVCEDLEDLTETAVQQCGWLVPQF